MKRRILFSLANGQDGEIELTDGIWIDFWCMVFKRNKQLFQIRGRNNQQPRGQMYSATAEWQQDPQEAQQLAAEYRTIINQSIDRILELGGDWQVGHMPEDPDWSDTNRIHRGFTTLNLTRHASSDLGLTPEQIVLFKNQRYNTNLTYTYPHFFRSLGIQVPDKPTHISAEAHEEIAEHCHTINAYVHHMEHGCFDHDRWIQHNQFVLEESGKQSVFCGSLDWDAKLADGVTDSERLDFNYASAFNQAISTSWDTSLNVYDLKNILGKDPYTCWLNHDNPVNVDIVNTVGTTKGGFTINPYNTPFHTQVIKPWLRECGHPMSDGLHCSPAIGRIDPLAYTRLFEFDQPATHEEKLKLRFHSVDLIETVQG